MDLYAGGGLTGESNVQDDQRLAGERLVCEDEAASIGTQSVLQVLPMAEPVNCFILTHLEKTMVSV